MKKIKHLFSIVILCIFVFVALASGGKSTEECKDDKRAYEFGREMKTWSQLTGGSSLSRTIESYSSSLGVGAPYNSDDPCVKCGWNDAEAGIDSPYNKSGKSWTKF